MNHNFFTGVCIAEVNPSELEAGSVKSLPRSLSESLAALEADSVLRKGLGEPLVKAVLAVRKVSVRALAVFKCSKCSLYFDDVMSPQFNMVQYPHVEECFSDEYGGSLNSTSSNSILYTSCLMHTYVLNFKNFVTYSHFITLISYLWH